MGNLASSAPSRVASSPRLLGSEVPRIWTPPLRPLTRKTSRGFECIEFAEEVLGIVLVPWQRWLLIHALEILDDGTFRFRTVVLLVARQNGKSTLMQVLSLWRMYVDAAPLVIGTAQNLDIAEEVWQGAVDMAEEIPELAAELDQVFKQPGKKFFRLTSGSRYKVQAATRRGGRGLSGDLVILDELREHQNWEAWSAVTNTTMAREFAQVWAASNAGDGTSVVLAYLRAQAHLALGDPDGINGGDARADDETYESSLGIFEWSAVPGLDIWDRPGWAQANPSLGHTALNERAMVSAAAAPESQFRTENLCQWVDNMSEGAFPAGVWESNVVGANVRITGTPVVAVDLRTGLQQSAAILVAGRTDAGYDLIEVARYELGHEAKWSHDFVFTETMGILAGLGLTSVAMDKVAGNELLVSLFEDAGITVVLLSMTDLKMGCAALTDGLINGRIKHKSEAALNIAVLGAGKRVSGEQFLWAQSKSTTDITALRAATVAWWVLASGAMSEYDPLDSVF